MPSVRFTIPLSFSVGSHRYRAPEMMGRVAIREVDINRRTTQSANLASGRTSHLADMPVFYREGGFFISVKSAIRR